MSDPNLGHGTHYLYEPFSRDGNLVFIAGQIPKTAPDKVLKTGICGAEHDLDSARESARLAARQAIHWIETAMDAKERLSRVLRVNIYVALTDDFTEMSEVADAASQAFVDHFGEAGAHPRSVIGVRRLPRNAPVLIEATASVRRPDASDATRKVFET